MAKEKILVHRLDVNEATDIFLPTTIDIPTKAKKILGFLFTTSLIGGEDDRPLIGTVKVISEALKKADIPDFDIFHNENVKWNKNFLPLSIPIDTINKSLKMYYNPFGNPINTSYSIRIYVKYLEKDTNGC